MLHGDRRAGQNPLNDYARSDDVTGTTAACDLRRMAGRLAGLAARGRGALLRLGLGRVSGWRVGSRTGAVGNHPAAHSPAPARGCRRRPSWCTSGHDHRRRRDADRRHGLGRGGFPVGNVSTRAGDGRSDYRDRRCLLPALAGVHAASPGPRRATRRGGCRAPERQPAGHNDRWPGRRHGGRLRGIRGGRVGRRGELRHSPRGADRHSPAL